MTDTPPSLQHATAVHLASENDDPRQARAELLSLVQRYNALLDNLGNAAFKNIGINEGEIVALAPGGLLPQSLQSSTAAVPVGTLLDFFRATPPDGWLEANGQHINNQNSEHEELFVLLFNLATQSQLSGQLPLIDLFVSVEKRDAAVAGNAGSAENAWNNNISLKLPDLRGRTRIGTGQGEGLTTTRALGEKLGEEAVTLVQANLPSIQLSIKFPQYSGNPEPEIRKEFSVISALKNKVFHDSTSKTNNRTEIMGSDTAHENMQPSIVVLTCLKY